MQTKQQIVEAINLAIADHRAQGALVDWDFIDGLRAAIAIVEAAPEVSVPAQQVSA